MALPYDAASAMMEVTVLDIDEGNERNGSSPPDRGLGGRTMSGYATRAEREQAEADFDALPPGHDEPDAAARQAGGTVSTVVSVRLRPEELAQIDAAAAELGLTLSGFIRQATLQAASPVDIRAAAKHADQLAHQAQQLARALRAPKAS